MHLSLLSDSYLADRLDDSGSMVLRRSIGRSHRDGLIRGLVFMAALAVPFGLAFASGHLDTASATPAAIPVVGSPVVDVQAVTRAAREMRPACDREPATFGLCRRLEPL